MYRRRMILSAALLVAVALVPAADAQQRPVGPGQQIPGDEGPVARDPDARFTWSMPDRYADGWDAWNENSARYELSYVRPSGWTIRIDACRSSGNGNALDTYEFTVRGVGSSFEAAASGQTCRRSFDGLPRLGSYDVSVVVKSGETSSARATERVTLRDWLIVSLGDSMASGEGSPDRNGRYTLGRRPATLSDLKNLFKPWEVAADSFRMKERRPVRWQDKRCHRSARAGHALAAERIEESDPHSSVTYVSLACSGAEIAHIWRDRYEGNQPPRRRVRHNPDGGRDNGTAPVKDLDPQLSALAKLVDGGPRRAQRRVDAVLMAIGINDLGFAGLVKGCATNPVPTAEGSTHCVYDTGITKQVNRELGPKYDKLAAELDSRLNLGEVYVTDYPSAPFGGSGACGLLGLPNVGITAMEAQAMYAVGLRFKEEMRRAAARNGWNWVPGMTEAFEGHDYCEGDHYLATLEQSLRRQGTIHGTSHPNPAGHRVLGGLLKRAIAVGHDGAPDLRATLTVKQVYVPGGSSAAAQSARADGGGSGDLGGADSGRLIVRFRLFNPGVEFPAEHTFDLGGVKGRWVDVPEGAVSFDVDICDRPTCPPRLARAVDAVMYGPGGTAPLAHGARDGFGLGEHESSSPKGLGVRYRVDIRRVHDPLSPPKTTAGAAR